MTIPISPPPLTEYRPEFLPAYLGNGVVGLRVPRIPQIDGVAILNGFSGIDGDSGAEGFARAPYPLAGDVEVNRVSLKMAPERVQLCTQSYDFGTGELRTVFDFDAGDVRAELEVLNTPSGGVPGGATGYGRSQASCQARCTGSPTCKPYGSCMPALSAASTAYARRTPLPGTTSGGGVFKSTRQGAGRRCSMRRTSTSRLPSTHPPPRARPSSGSRTGRTTTTTAVTSCGTSRCSRFPPLVLTNPEAARSLLDYRAERLQAARHNASMSGYKGAQFPWESSPRYGEESAPGEGAASAHEHHVSMDVAVAFSQFLHATHDWEWGRKRAWDVLAEVAAWIASRGVETERGFEIREVNGIAERKETVDNNAFVNMAAAVALREAVALARPLGHAADPRWERLAGSIFLRIDRNSVIRNHDQYRPSEEKGETPEAAAGLFPLTFECGPAVEGATLAYYLRLADKYVGAPMLSALLGVYAARLGDRERALELFERGYADFVIDPFALTTEYAPAVFPEQPIAGPFTANLGGFLTSCLYGLPGIQLRPGEPEGWCTRPVTLPKGWSELHVDRVWARGQAFRLSARHGDTHAVLECDPS